MQLSVIIVNYNVRHFLRQALESVFNSRADFEFEVFVVDNHSVDGSVEMVQRDFPQVKLIANKENTGFSKANNQAIRQSSGKYVLLLNPDTIVNEDTFEKIVGFMEGHPDAGGLGVKMMDGQGHFLPESKRGFPTPFVAFCKMSGLSRLFPKSARFNRYHMGHLDRNQISEVDVLSGACMLLRKSVLDEVGLLDEDYFMYGEDIDLSYRIKKAGYKNYYFPETEIIHFKGESTRKGSFNYVRMFYNAMIIFTRKHLHGPGAEYQAALLRTAIYGRAAVALVRRIAEKIFWPAADAAIIYAAMTGIKALWEVYIKPGTIYPESYLFLNLPLYIAVWLFTFYLRGGYDKPVRLKQIPASIAIGTVIILAIYALLPMSLRTSRAMILVGAVSAGGLMLLTRLLIKGLQGDLDSLVDRDTRVLIVAGPDEYRRIGALLEEARADKVLVGRSAVHAEKNDDAFLGTLDDVEEIVSVMKVDEIIFSMKDISHREIMDIMSRIGARADYRIISEGSDVIIGSHSRNTAGDLLTVDINFHLNLPAYRRTKRILDVLISIFFLTFSPVLFWFARNKGGYFPNIFKVLFGRKTWVGFAGNQLEGLPKLPPAVIPLVDAGHPENLVSHANVAYAKDYEWWMDVKRMWRV